MIRVLVDSNVVIDYLGQRGKFYEPARRLMIFACLGDYELWMSPSQVTDVHYVLSGGRRSGSDAAREALRGLRRIVRVCALGEEEVDRALDSPWDDFEDALVYGAAQGVGARVIVTRNKGDFAGSMIPVMDADEFFEWMERENHLSYAEIRF